MRIRIHNTDFLTPSLQVKTELGDENRLGAKKMEDLGVAEDLTVSRHGKLLGLAFQRIILDEAHTIR